MSEKNIEYCSTWASSQYDAGYKAPSADLPDFTDCTLRQIIRVSGGAERIRVRFSNFLGKTPLELKSVHIAKSSEQGTGHIDLASDTVITFGSKESVTIPAGEKHPLMVPWGRGQWSIWSLGDGVRGPFFT